MQDLEEKEGRVAAPGLGGAMPVGTVSAKKPAKRIFGVRASTLFLICYIAAFLGWWVENLFRTFTAGVFDSRHQLLPFLGAYGFGIFVMFFVFGTPSEMRIFKKRILPERTAKNHILRSVVYCAVMFCLILFGEMGMGLLFGVYRAGNGAAVGCL